jgi:signal transduction histidine kinase
MTPLDLQRLRHRRWRRIGPIGRFVRARLRRRIFAWFAGGIFVTVALTALVLMVLARLQEPEWQRSMERGVAWVGQQFGRDWNEPAKRDAFVRATAAQLDMNLELRDGSGSPLVTVGDVCKHHTFVVPIVRDGVSLGSLQGCLRRTPSASWRWGLALFFAVAMLWLASGKVARRLARPLDDLTEVVQRIGAGDLKARTDLSCREPDELGVVAEAVNEMASRIEKQLADQRELLAAVSHELRTPLARMRIISEIARDTGATPKTYDDLDREVQEMDALVGQLLASSRIDFGVIAMRTLSVRDIVARALERSGLSPQFAQIEGEEDTVTGDATLLQRAIANLLDNAKKHAGAAESLRVVVRSDGVSFDVLDRGPGLPEGGEAALFRKFQRGEHEREPSDGLGLGLALVKRIAEAHGGTVWARQRDGGGAVFGFSVGSTRAPSAVRQGPGEVSRGALEAGRAAEESVETSSTGFVARRAVRDDD